jgi:hypothetical protein
MFETKVVKQSKHFLCSVNFFFRKSHHLRHNVEKYGGTGQATDDNTAHVHCMLDTSGYKYALKYAIIIAFPLHLSLRYTYIACLVLHNSM